MCKASFINLVRGAVGVVGHQCFPRWSNLKELLLVSGETTSQHPISHAEMSRGEWNKFKITTFSPTFCGECVGRKKGRIPNTAELNVRKYNFSSGEE